MREVETLAQEENEPALIIQTVSGSRDRNGINEKEIKAAFNHLRVILAQLDSKELPTLGFLSPFRAQVDFFQKRLQEEFSPAYQRRLLHDHQLIAGTAHSFQGAERDIMLISLAIDTSSPSAARRFLERPEVFNVSITRARHRIQLFTSISPHDLPHDSLLCRYLLHATADNRVTPNLKTTETNLPPRLLTELEANDWTIIGIAAQVAGMPVDLLIKKENRLIAIDLIGTADTLGQALSIEKTLLLKRAGLPLFPLSLAEWAVRPKDFLSEITQ